MRASSGVQLTENVNMDRGRRASTAVGGFNDVSGGVSSGGFSDGDR